MIRLVGFLAVYAPQGQLMSKSQGWLGLNIFLPKVWYENCFPMDADSYLITLRQIVLGLHKQFKDSTTTYNREGQANGTEMSKEHWKTKMSNLIRKVTWSIIKECLSQTLSKRMEKLSEYSPSMKLDFFLALFVSG